MREEDRMAYIAGLIDGDGSLSLLKKQEANALSPLYYPCIQFSKSTDTLPNILKNSFGGTITIVKRNYKNCHEYRWKLEKSTKCMPFLTEIAPYLHNKYEQSQELIKFMEENTFKRGKPLSIDDLTRRESSYLRMKSINARRDNISRLKKSNRESFKSDYFWAYLAGLS